MLTGISFLTFGIVLPICAILFDLPGSVARPFNLVGLAFIIAGVIFIIRDRNKASSQKTGLVRVCTGCGVNLAGECAQCPACGVAAVPGPPTQSATRTCFRAPYSASWGTVDHTIAEFLTNEGFSRKDIDGEACWKKGTGLATGMQFAKVEYTESEAVIYAWIQNGIGSAAGQERNLEGFVGALPKKMLRGRMEKLVQAIGQLTPGSTNIQFQEQQIR